MAKDPGAFTDPALALRYESRPWTQDDDSGMSRRSRLRTRGPYRAAVVSRIAEHSFRLDPDVLSEAADALSEIVRFDAELARAVVGTGAAEFAPLTAVLLRTESASSSQIENVTAGARALALATIEEKAGPNAQLVAANVTAMQRAVAMADDLSEETLLAAHQALLAGHDHAMPGAYRDVQVWVGGSAASPHTAEFVPPHHENIAGAMADLLAFCDRTDLPVLAQVAIAHAQLETIHPFVDGNGRTGRALVHVLLRRTGTTRQLTVPVSAGLLNDTASYFAALSAYRRGDASPIVARFAEAAFAAIDNGRRLNSELADLYARWEHAITARSDAAVWRVLGHLLQQPAVTVRFVQAAANVSGPAAQNAIDQLVVAGVLVPATANQRRNRVWIAQQVVEALDAFAERSGRRQPG